MHEASMVESLIELVERNLPQGRRAGRIDVRVGLLTGVSPDAMRFYFDLMREGTVGPQAELVVSLEPLQARCQGCGTESLLSKLTWTCPACGTCALSFRNGDELHLSSFEVIEDENGEGSHD